MVQYPNPRPTAQTVGSKCQILLCHPRVKKLYGGIPQVG